MSCYDMVLLNDSYSSAMSYQFCTNPYDRVDNTKPSDTDPIVDNVPVANNTDGGNNNNIVVQDEKSSSSSGMPQSTLIAIIVGICVPLILIAILVPLIIICCKKYKKDKEGKKEEV